ncbi:MAG TPA: tetratricopeptide repeat protein [Kofleriaceae bacterium]|jgi:hypothetical protein
MRSVLLILVLIFGAGVAHADDRADARSHYQAGQKAYSSGDYRAAIREFSAAQQLLPADLNNYNLALCYDKLGDADPAIQYYRAFLDKNPGSDKRPEIDASISRLEAASKSAHAKADAAAAAKVKAEPAPMPAAPPAPVTQPSAPPPGPAPAGPESYQGPVAMGSQGTPSSPQIVSTGDAQLDRVQQIDINRVRDERYGDQGAPRGASPQSGSPQSPQSLGPTGEQAPPPPSVASGQPQGLPANTPEAPHKDTPLYKKWWFWCIVGVAAFVVIEIAATGGSDDSSSTNVRGRELPPGPTGYAPTAIHGGGLTLLRF